MPAEAVRLGHVRGHDVVASPYVLALRHWLKVCRFTAGRKATSLRLDVINDKARRNRSNKVFVHDSVNRELLPAHRKPSVPVWLRRSLPHQALANPDAPCQHALPRLFLNVVVMPWREPAGYYVSTSALAKPTHVILI